MKTIDISLLCRVEPSVVKIDEIDVKPNGKIALNIQSVKSYPNIINDIIELTNNIGLVNIDKWGLCLSGWFRSGYKTEPILIFKNK